MSARLLLVRHGSHDEVGRILSGRSEIGLNARGAGEAVRLADWLGDEAIAAVHSSPRQRAVETARAIAAPRGLDIIIEPALDEIDFGNWTGRSFADLDDDPDWQHWNEARGSARAPAGETMAEAAARVVAATERLANGGGTIVCVSHGDVIRALVAHYLGLALGRILSFDVEPASVSVLAAGRVVAVNRIAA